MQEIGGYTVTFGPGENVTIGGRTLTLYEWLKLDVIPSPNYTGSMVIKKARCNGDPEVIAPEHFNALHRALVEHAQSLKGGGEFCIHQTLDGKNSFGKAVAENDTAFAGVLKDGSGYLNMPKSWGWHRVPAPWWEVKCMVCGSKILIYHDGRFQSSCNGYNQTSCCFITREGNKLIFKKDGKTFTCSLVEGDWHPELVEDVKRAIRVKRDFCSQCYGQVFYEDKKCRQCGAEFPDE